MGFLEVPCAILAGAVSLSAADVASLAPSDLIIPDDPPVLAGRAFLERPWHPWIVLGLEGGQAVVASLKPEDAGPKESGLQEIGMDDKLAPPKGAAQAEDKAAGDLSPPSEIELPLRFEIGRRMMALKELEALAPGAVIPLDNDPKSPLTVTCHGKPLAKGVLVDLGDGRLGVRLTDVGNANGQVTGPNSAPRP
jgi:type III secretion system YscQ/HrcQ family protein